MAGVTWGSAVWFALLALYKPCLSRRRFCLGKDRSQQLVEAKLQSLEALSHDILRFSWCVGCALRFGKTRKYGEES